MSKLTIFYRLMAAIISGLIGTLFILLIYILGIMITGHSENPASGLILIFMIFTGSLISNLLNGVFLSFVDAEKYCRKSTMLWQAFLINMFLLLVSFPFYVLVKEVKLIAFIQIVITAFASNIIYELFARDWSYILTGLYGSLFAVFIIFVSLGLIENIQTENMFLFAFLPFVWFIISLLTIFIEYVYILFYKFFNVAVLDPKNQL